MRRIQWMPWTEFKKVMGGPFMWLFVAMLAIGLWRTIDARDVAQRNHWAEQSWQRSVQQYREYAHARDYLRTGRLVGASQDSQVTTDLVFVRQIKLATDDIDRRELAYTVWRRASYYARQGLNPSVKQTLADPASTPLQIVERAWAADRHFIPWGYSDSRNYPGYLAMHDYLRGLSCGAPTMPSRPVPMELVPLLLSKPLWVTYFGLNILMGICFAALGGTLRRKSVGGPFHLVLPSNPIGWVVVMIYAPAFVGLLLSEILVEGICLYVVLPVRRFARFMVEFDFSTLFSSSPREDVLADTDVEVLRARVGAMRTSISSISNIDKRVSLLKVLDDAEAKLSGLVREEQEHAAVAEVQASLDELVLVIDSLRDANAPL